MATIGAPAPPVALDDQFGTHRALDFSAAPTLLVFADRGSATGLAGWVRALCDGVGDRATVVGVAAVGEVPQFARPVVRTFLRAAASVLVDWGDAVAGTYGYRGGSVMVVLVGSDAVVAHEEHDAERADAVARLVAAVGGAGAAPS